MNECMALIDSTLRSDNAPINVTRESPIQVQPTHFCLYHRPTLTSGINFQMHHNINSDSFTTTTTTSQSSEYIHCCFKASLPIYSQFFLPTLIFKFQKLLLQFNRASDYVKIHNIFGCSRKWTANFTSIYFFFFGWIPNNVKLHLFTLIPPKHSVRTRHKTYFKCWIQMGVKENVLLRVTPHWHTIWSIPSLQSPFGTHHS